MRRYVAAIALCFSTTVCGALPGVTEFRKAPEAITDVELSALLKARVAAADVIAIGETIHGSSALLKVQTRLVRYLVENHGVRLIVWENATLRSLELSRWISSCTTAKQTPAPLAVLYFPTEGDRPMWDWVCEYNRAHPKDPIVFRGMDVWDRPWEHYVRIDSLAARVGVAPQVASGIRTCPAQGLSSWAEVQRIYADLDRDKQFLPAAGYEKCRAALTAILDTARRAGGEKKKASDPGSDDAFELALSASTLLGWLGFYNYLWSDDILSWNERDRAQGRNLMLLMEKHGAARAVVAAHTSHVSHNRSRADWWGYGDLKSGVFFFSDMTKKKVFNIALTAYQATGAQGDWALPTAPNSLDRKLHDAGHVFSFLFSNAAFLSEHPRWWLQNGNAAGMENGIELVLADHFDAVFFLDRSLLDKALPARDVWQP